jgi:hypothetical protein
MPTIEIAGEGRGDSGSAARLCSTSTQRLAAGIVAVELERYGSRRVISAA